MASQLEPLKQGEKIREGDLIWIPGHVMVVASLPNNTIIEARGYRAGYGKIHELPLNKLLKILQTGLSWNRLASTKKPLNLLNKEGRHKHHSRVQDT